MASARSTPTALAQAAPAVVLAALLALGAVVADDGASGPGVTGLALLAVAVSAFAALQWFPAIGVAIGLFMAAWFWCWNEQAPGMGPAIVGVALYALYEAAAWGAGGRHRLAGGSVETSLTHLTVVLGSLALGFAALELDSVLAEGRPALVIGSIGIIGLLLVVGQLPGYTSRPGSRR